MIGFPTAIRLAQAREEIIKDEKAFGVFARRDHPHASKDVVSRIVQAIFWPNSPNLGEQVNGPS